MILTDYVDRDPEAEAEDKIEEEKLPGVEEAGVEAIESGFATAGGDWEAAPAAGFAAPTTSAEWGDAVQTGQSNWDAAGAATTTTEWGAEAPKETPAQW